MASRPSPRVLAYALAIAVPTLVLLVLGLQSVRRQQQAIAQLEAANRRLSADQLARDVATRVAEAAGACLGDAMWSRVSARGPIPAGLVGAIARRCPTAVHLLVTADTEVLHPRLVTPLELADPDPAARACGDAVTRAETHEFAGQPQQAVPLYRECVSHASGEARARVLARLARAQRLAGDRAAAADTYVALVRDHADATDRFARPFGLVAPLEYHDLRPAAAVPLLAQARADLASGRWDVSDEQARYFLDEIGQRLGPPPGAIEGPYLEKLALARALQSALPLQTSADAGGVHADEVVVEGRRTRVYHARVGAEGPVVRAVLVPSRAWVEQALLPHAARALDLDGPARLLDGEPPAGERGVVASADGALAPWRVWVALPREGASSRWLPVVLQGAITLLVSGVLGMGVLLLMRDVRREQSLAQMRSQFVSAASHELRTPLAMILLYAQTLLEDVDADREERRGSYEIIAQESERLRHLLDKVLDFARIDAGRRSYRFVVADLDESVRAAVRLIEPHLARRGFTLHADIASVPGVRHDTEAVTGAVLNLLENAAKYSGLSREIDLTLTSDEARATIAVRDHGIGIPAEDLPHIGEQFFRSRLSTGIGGHGLGLYLVHHAMAAHGGRMDVASAPGDGSTFTLVLPRGGAPAQETMS